jgi:formamidopyrimidine-DNA glycosylase
MNQYILASVGNIYATESLFIVNINPIVSADKVIKMYNVGILVNGIKRVLNTGIEFGGTTLKNFLGRPGSLNYFSTGIDEIFVRPPIVRVKESARSTFYCINYQR